MGKCPKELEMESDMTQLCKKLSDVTHFWDEAITLLPSPKIDFAGSKSILSWIWAKIDFDPPKSILGEGSGVIAPCQKCITSDNFLQSGAHITFHF